MDTYGVVPHSMEDGDDTHQDSEMVEDRDDPVFREIEERLTQSCGIPAGGSDSGSLADGEIETSEDFVHWPNGFQPRAAYEHARKSTNIMGVSYNSRMRQLIMTDSTGVVVWNKDAVNGKAHRAMLYPKYQYGLIVSLIFARKYNVYFALWKDFSVKVLNREFQETCSVHADMRSVMYMLFNPVRDELITGGVGGLKVWSYQQVTDETWTDIKAMANYKLKLKYVLPRVGGSWVKRVDLDLTLQHLYCCSETDLLAYDMDGNKLFQFERAHAMSITGCVYSSQGRLLVTASRDTEVKCWSIAGGLIHTFRGHSRDVTNVLLHPETSTLFLTSSLDGTVRLWSLDTMDLLYSLAVSSDGVRWMGLTDDKMLYAGTVRNVTVWSVNMVYSFWALARSKVTRLSLVHAEGKSTRLMALGEDSSVRLFARGNQKNLSTVLPPPPLSPLQSILCVTYSRALGTMYLLINNRELWIYTMRTDPASRVAVWDILQIQAIAGQVSKPEETTTDDGPPIKRPSTGHQKDLGPPHRATENGTGNDAISPCYCVCHLDSPAMMWGDEGHCCPIQNNYLLLGLEDGRILFMDPIVKGKKYMEFKANKDIIYDLRHDVEYNTLVCCCGYGEEGKVLQIWALPTLTLLSEVYCPTDLTGYSRLNTSMMTGHRSGMVMLHPLISVENRSGGFRQKFLSTGDMDSSDSGKHEHMAPVLAVDSCPALEIFFSASPDGSVKVWNEAKKLLTEISLENTLSAACFISDRGDIAIGFKNQIFCLDHTKVCPSITVAETMEDQYETESDILEDPAVKYEGVSANPDPVDLDNYLVPFNLDFSSGFMEGKTSAVVLKKTSENEEDESETESLSFAPTDIYQSPFSTPRRLSLVDLTLSSHINKLDLKNTAHRQQLWSSEMTFEDGSPPPDVPRRAFEMPVFGTSPGPTPSPSPPSSPCTPSSFHVSSGGESTPPGSDTDQKVNNFKPIKVHKENKPASKIETPIAVPAKNDNLPKAVPHVESRAAAIRIDALSLLRNEAKKQTLEKSVGSVKKVADHSHSRQNLPDPREGKPSSATVKKKQFVGQRKRPKRGERSQEPEKSTGDETKSTHSRKPRPKTRLRRGETSIRKACLESSSDESDHDNTPKQKETFSVDIKPRLRVGASASPGVSSSETDAQISKKKMIEFEGPPTLGKSPTLELLGQTSEEGEKGMDINGNEADERADTMACEESVGDDLQEKTNNADEVPMHSVNQNGTKIHLLDPNHDSASRVKIHFQLIDAPPSPHGKIQLWSTSRSPSPIVAVDDSSSVLSGHMYPKNLNEWQRLRPDSHISRSSSHFSRGRSPTLVSDAGSEWTMPVTEDSALQASGDEAQQDGWEEEESKGLSYLASLSHISDIHVGPKMHRPLSGPISGTTQAKTGPSDDDHLKHKRAHTSLELTAEKMDALYDQFEALLGKYKGTPGTPDYIEQLYQNDGKKFGSDWHEKMAERHILLRMQHQLRAQSASNKRHILNVQRQQELLHNQSHHHMSDPPPSIQIKAKRSKSETSFHHIQRAQSCRVRVPSASSSRYHIQGAPTSMPPTCPPSRLESQRRMRRPHTAAARFVATPAPSEHSESQTKQERTPELPFRLRLGREKVPVCSQSEESTTREELQLLDPRNPDSRAFRPQSAKSIPSKCSRYVLITPPKDKSGKILPTRLEKRLIPKRFPAWKRRWLGKSSFSPSDHTPGNQSTVLIEQTTF